MTVKITDGVLTIKANNNKQSNELKTWYLKNMYCKDHGIKEIFFDFHHE